jgi:hypothetical protein
VILVLAQPSSFAAPATPTVNSGIEKYDFEAYVKSAGLGSIVAGTYITVERGTATASVSATSAVDTATLSVASSASGASSTGTRTGTTSASASAPAGTNAASGRAVEWGMLGAAVLLGAVAF